MTLDQSLRQYHTASWRRRTKTAGRVFARWLRQLVSYLEKLELSYPVESEVVLLPEQDASLVYELASERAQVFL